MKASFIFPHCFVPHHIKLPLSFFPINICKPWYMEEKEKDQFNVLFPEEKLKPPGEFLRLIEEYKRWIRDQERGNPLFMLIEKDMWQDDESPIHIRNLIRGMDKKEEIDLEMQRSIKWHLFLHLATEFEISQYEVDQEILNISKRRSLLEGVIEDAPKSLDNMFQDVPDYRTDPILDENVIQEIIKAWIGLFGRYTEKDSTLITFNKSVFELLRSNFEDLMTKDLTKRSEIPVREREIDGIRIKQVIFPILMEKRKDEISDFISGKTLIYV